MFNLLRRKLKHWWLRATTYLSEKQERLITFLLRCLNSLFPSVHQPRQVQEAIADNCHLADNECDYQEQSSLSESESFAGSAVYAERESAKTHVFIGAGPANLDRALKIRKQDPSAKFVFIDKRVSSTGELDRHSSRANIFRFPLSDKNKLINSAFDKHSFAREFDKVSTERAFSEDNGFQSGDTQVFGNERFTQIQIRDLQQVFLNDLKRGGNVAFVDANVDINEFYQINQQSKVNDIIVSSLRQEVDRLQRQLDMPAADSHQAQLDRGIKANRIDYIQQQIRQIESAGQTNNITYHNAAGALREGPKEHGSAPDAIFYQPSGESRHTIGSVSIDLSSMPVTAMHGTATFSLNDSGIEPKDLTDKTISLDNWVR